MRTTSRRTALLRFGAFMAAVVVGLVLLTGLWLGLGLPPQRVAGVLQPGPELLTGVLTFGLVLTVSRWLVRRSNGRGLSTLGLGLRRGRWRMVVVGLALGALTPAVGLMTLSGLGLARVSVAASDVHYLFALTLPMTLATALLSSWEELAFHGYGMQALSGGFGPGAAVVTTGILFGLAHAGNPGADPLGLLNVIVNGTLLGAVVMRTGSLSLACGYHSGWNLALGVVSGAVDSGMRSGGAVLATTLHGAPWLTGGDFGPEASLLLGGLETAVLLVAVRLAPRFVDVDAASHYQGEVPLA